MKLIYDIKDKPKFGQLIVFAIQQLLAIMAATLAVPSIIGNGMSPAAALFGAGIGTLVYVLFTKKSSPVFLGSSFAFIPSLAAAFAGAGTFNLSAELSKSLGYLGIVLGAAFAGLVYVIIALVIKLIGVNWVDKLMPAVVIGPTVSIIGLSLAGNAVGNLKTGGLTLPGADAPSASVYVTLICGLVTLFVVCISSVYGKKMGRLIPFIFGILAGYGVSAIFTIIGIATKNPTLQVIDFSHIAALFADGITINTFVQLPDFTFVEAFKGFEALKANPSFLVSVLVAYVPVAFVVFAEHIADHKNISSIINKDLIKDPGLSKTLLGDGVGSMVGAFFGGCPNTTYGESVACVAITKNASVVTIIATAVLAILISFLSPFVAIVSSIPPCVMGGVCIALYGFIAVSGLKMIQKVNLDENKNLFVVSGVLIAGIGGLSLSFGKIQVPAIACALILGIVLNLIVSKKKDTVKVEDL